MSTSGKIKTVFLCEILFYRGSRKSVPQADYCPHIVMDGDAEKEYLGILIYDIEVDALNQTGYAMFNCIYDSEKVGYHKIETGKTFSVMEGGNDVGKGKIVERHDYPDPADKACQRRGKSKNRKISRY